ncbi:5'/3'-nucleotidase SurE [Alphaproteobacteria bacterium]|nr:5'/3'-nucleotidase SurE [Alphaproteobacteria bacterium]
MKKIKKILITNDDGFDAIGLEILKDIAKKFSEDVYIVSPKNNQSAKSKSITINKEIYFDKITDYIWIVDGTPTDCVIFALNHIMKINKPDLILSGINAGSNIGDEVSYSGTVAAAWEGAVRGINSIALSQYGGDNTSESYTCSKKHSFDIINYLFNFKAQSKFFFNVNFPYILSKTSHIQKFSFTKLESQKKGDEIIINENSKSFRIGRMINYNKPSFQTDLDILKDNRISITPLSLNLTNYKLLNELQKKETSYVI